MSRRDTNASAEDLHGGRLRIPRSRGAVSGFLLILLGAWGALIPFLGPYAHFGYTPNTTWVWTGARFWLEVLPGVAVALGGFLLLTGTNRITASLGGWIAAAGGAWFIVGIPLAGVLHLGSIGGPISSSTGEKALETLALFSGLGALILFFAAGALGRLAVVGVRDVRAARRRADQERAEQERIENDKARARQEAADEARADQERIDRERADRDKAEQERVQQARADGERVARDRAAAQAGTARSNAAAPVTPPPGRGPGATRLDS